MKSYVVGVYLGECFQFNLFKYILCLLIHLLVQHSSFLYVDLSSHLVSFFFSVWISVTFFFGMQICWWHILLAFLKKVIILLLFLRNIINKYRILGWLFLQMYHSVAFWLTLFLWKVCSRYLPLDMSFSSGCFCNYLITYDLQQFHYDISNFFPFYLLFVGYFGSVGL